MGESREQRARGIILGELAKRGWKLVGDEADFVDKILEELEHRCIADKSALEQATLLQRATIRQYCVILHTACSETGSALQRAAFRELWCYLYPMAYYKTSDSELAQDLTQQALLNIWRNLSRIQPGNFLAYAKIVLLNGIRERYRKEGRGKLDRSPDNSESVMNESEMGHPDESEGTGGLGEIGDTSADEVDRSLLNKESERELLVILGGCLKNPRERQVVVALFFEDKRYVETAQELGLTVDHVHVLRHRGLAKLRQCEAYRQFVEDNLK